MSSLSSPPSPARWVSLLPHFKVMDTEAAPGAELCRPQARVVQAPSLQGQAEEHRVIIPAPLPSSGGI